MLVLSVLNHFAALHGLTSGGYTVFAGYFVSLGLSVQQVVSANRLGASIRTLLTQNAHVLVGHDVGHANSKHLVVGHFFRLSWHLGFGFVTTIRVSTVRNFGSVHTVALSIYVVLIHVIDTLVVVSLTSPTLSTIRSHLGIFGSVHTVIVLLTIFGGVHAIGVLLAALGCFEATNVGSGTSFTGLHAIYITVLRGTGGFITASGILFVIQLSMVLGQFLVLHFHKFFGLMGFARMTFFLLALGLETAISSFFALGGRFFVSFVVDVFYNLHDLAVGTFSVLPADFSLVHKFLFRKLSFEVSRLLRDFSAFATRVFTGFFELRSIWVCHLSCVSLLSRRGASSFFQLLGRL